MITKNTYIIHCNLKTHIVSLTIIKASSFSTLVTKIRNEQAFKNLGLDFSSILNDPKNSAYMLGFLNTLTDLSNNLNHILNENKGSLKEKQVKLEKLSEKSQAFDLELRYNVPTSLSKLIEKLDLYLLDPEILNSEEIDPYLPSILATNLGEHTNLKRTYRTKTLRMTIDLLKDILKVYKTMGNSFGLFLIYTLVMSLRSNFNDHKIKEKIEEKLYPARTNFFGDFEINGEELSVQINLKRIDVTSDFGTKLIESFLHLGNACYYDFQKIGLANIENFETLNSDEQKQQLFTFLSKTDPEKFELFKTLEKYVNVDLLSSEQKGHLGVHCVFILEAINVLADSGLVRQEKEKTSSVVALDKRYAKDVYSIPTRPKNLPMISRPNPWQKEKKTKTGNLNYGGYFFNRKLNYPAIQNHHKKGVTLITDEDLAGINYLQSNFYTINKEFLRYMELNFKEVLTYFLRKLPNSDYFIKNLYDKETSNIEIQSLTELFLHDKERAKLLNQLKDEPKRSKALERAIIKRQNDLTEQYKDVANIFFGLIHGYIIAYYYQTYKFYFTVFMDNRGRVYYNPTGSAFGLQTGDFSKSLIDLKGNDYQEDNVLYPPKYSSNNQAYVDYVESLKKDKEPFQLKRVEKGILPTTISNDASCSGTSILSGLIGYEEGLLLTNVLVNNQNDTGKKQCIYTHFLEKMRQEYPIMIDDIYTSKQMHDKSSKLEISLDEFKKSVEDCLFMIRSKILQREHTKVFVMRINYSEGNKGRNEYIYDNILRPALIAANQGTSYDEERIFRSVSHRLAEWIERLYHKTFISVSGLRDNLVEQFKEQTVVTLTSAADNNFSYQQLLYKTVKIPRPKAGKPARNADLSYHIRTDEVDAAKMKRSLVANFTHFLDARLNFGVINECRKNSIVLWTNHDCFYVSPEHKDKLLEIYFNVFIETLVRRDVLEHFLSENSIPITGTLKESLADYKVKRNEILKKLETGELKRSKFILTS